MKVEKTQRFLIGVHQEDERIQYLIKRKPYLAIGVAILKSTEMGLELVYMKEFTAERQVELDVELEPGNYFLLPRTSGCGFHRPADAKKEHIKLMDKSGDLTPMAELMVKDIFRRLDDFMVNNKLEYKEFLEFQKKIGQTMTEEEFKSQILRKYCNNNQGAVNRRGFIEYIKDSIRTKGENTVWGWLAKWGYDENAYGIEARTFMLTIHSMEMSSLQVVKMTKQRDLD